MEARVLEWRWMSVLRWGGFWGVVLLFSFGSGCTASKPDNGMVPVSGKLEVDGQPAIGVVIELHPQENAPTLARGISSEGGRFEISTMTQGDGAKPGTYDVTFVWSEFNIVTRAQEGDQLNGRYAKPGQSTIQWTVPEGDRWDAGTIRLSSKQ